MKKHYLFSVLAVLSKSPFHPPQHETFCRDTETVGYFEGKYPVMPEKQHGYFENYGTVKRRNGIGSKTLQAGFTAGCSSNVF